MRRRRGVNVNVNRRRGPGLVGTMAKTAVVAGTATATIGATQKMMGGGNKQAAPQQADADQQQTADMQAQQAYLEGQQDALAQQQAAAAEQAPADDSFEQQLVQIQQLSALKDQGVLTEEEFQAKKAQILGI